MDAAQAYLVYDIIVMAAGASEDERDQFVDHQTKQMCREWRFRGSLGQGGKFRRAPDYDSPVAGAERWSVDAYPEDVNPERQKVINVVNVALAALAKEGTQ